jgi:hypothetical protein
MYCSLWSKSVGSLNLIGLVGSTEAPSTGTGLLRMTGILSEYGFMGGGDCPGNELWPDLYGPLSMLSLFFQHIRSTPRGKTRGGSNGRKRCGSGTVVLG